MNIFSYRQTFYKTIYNGYNHTIRRWNLSIRKISTEVENNTALYENIPVDRIRNFSIIAHVDHGKSTLADRLLEFTGTVSKKEKQNQILDNLQVERERGITVKAQSASLLYNYQNTIYLLNLIDTPGHVDFSNEVSRSLTVCDGVILLVDANHGVQAQTVANYHLAQSKNLKVIPVLNKIDLKHANPEKVCKELNTLFDILPEDVLKISAKLGTGIESVLEAIILKIPPPISNRELPFCGILFDGWYDRYRGALNLIYVKNGELKISDQITSCNSKKSYDIKSLSILRPTETSVSRLIAGQIGLVGCNMRNSQESTIGDTFHHKNIPVEALPGFKALKPLVYAGIYPTEQSQHVSLRSAIEKLVLNDSVVTVIPESSPALGQGWRLGFLGLLHMEVFCQRLQQEFGADPVITAPSVTYRIKLKKTKQTVKLASDIVEISNPNLLPERVHIEEYFEPYVLGTIITPSEYLGAIIGLCVEHRGVQKTSSNIDNTRIMMTYMLPLNEIIIDFYDSLKALSSGYASFDYEDAGYHNTEVVKLSIFLNNQLVEELSSIVHCSKAQYTARKVVNKLKDMIPRQMVQIAIQAYVGSKILARENIKAYRKDVTAKLYGGDVTRRMKLLKQQAEGKKKMRTIANINVPKDTFINLLKR